MEIRPITLIVGENSTGKSTILGCLQAITNYIYESSDKNIDFNSPPFEMGGFEDIISRKQIDKGRFKLGVDIQKDDKIISAIFELIGNDSELEVNKVNLSVQNEILTKIEAYIDDLELDPERHDMGDAIELAYNKQENKFSIRIDEQVDCKNIISLLREVYSTRHYERLSLFNRLEESNINNFGESGADVSDEYRLAENMDTIFSESRFHGSNIEVKSFGPIQSSPKRTYNPIDKRNSSEEEYMPFVIRDLQNDSRGELTKIKENIQEFVDESQLFTDFKVRTFTSSKRDPFQLEFIRDDQSYNYVDVGYGISQIMPVIIGILNIDNRGYSRNDQVFLMEQPEIHLHPKAQSAFLSFLANILASKRGHKRTQFILETHSDYFIDRARIEIKQGTIKHDDVSLVYLEAQEDGVKIHNITFDEIGNFKNEPDDYRSFFLRETERLLGF